MAKNREIREMTRAEVEAKLKQESEALFNLEMRRRFQQIPNPLKLRTTRRQVARLKTILREDELGIRTLASSPHAAPAKETGSKEG